MSSDLPQVIIKALTSNKDLCYTHFQISVSEEFVYFTMLLCIPFIK